MSAVCVPARHVFFAAAGTALTVGAVVEHREVSHAVSVVAWWAPRLLIGACAALMLGYAAVCALLEHHRRGGGRYDRTAAVSQRAQVRGGEHTSALGNRRPGAG